MIKLLLLVSAISTFSLKPIVEWQKPSLFPTKMTLAHVHALLSSILVVILVLESEGFYYVALENIHTQVEGYWEF